MEMGLEKISEIIEKDRFAAHVAIDYLAAPGDTPCLEAEARLTTRAGRTGYYGMEVRSDVGDVIAVCHGRVRYTSESLD